MEKYEYTERTLNRIRDYVAKYYRYTFDFDFIDLATETVANALFDDDLESAIERSLIYTKDKWTILRKYCFPKTADWNIAEELWVEQITEIYNHIKETAPWEE